MCGPMSILRSAIESIAWALPSLFIPAMSGMLMPLMFGAGALRGVGRGCGSGDASCGTSAGEDCAGLSAFVVSSGDFCSCADNGRSANRVSETAARIPLLIGLSDCTNPE